MSMSEMRRDPIRERAGDQGSHTRPPYQHRDRCVHCGRPESAHSENSVCVSGGPFRVFQTLNLPSGKTCGDCVHTARCTAIFGHISEDRTCDFFPVRFQQRSNS